MSSYDLCRSLWSLARLRPDAGRGEALEAKAMVVTLQSSKGISFEVGRAGDAKKKVNRQIFIFDTSFQQLVISTVMFIKS